VAKELKEEQIAFYLARVKADIMSNLVAYGALEAIPEDHIFHAVDLAVNAAHSL
jgi:hypothetical protein